jgi:cytochrome c553
MHAPYVWRILRTALLVCPLCAAASAHGAGPTHARLLAAACFTCHGTEGRSVGNVPPSLAGRDRDELARLMKEFRSGDRPSTVMGRQAKAYSDAEIEAIAGYFAAIPAASAR